jgi:hypothetical protein
VTLSASSTSSRVVRDHLHVHVGYLSVTMSMSTISLRLVRDSYWTMSVPATSLRLVRDLVRDHVRARLVRDLGRDHFRVRDLSVTLSVTRLRPGSCWRLVHDLSVSLSITMSVSATCL